MAMEKTEGIVLRAIDWSESSKIAALWTRDLGKVRVLAKGGKRLRSNFDSALDILTACDIVLLRKNNGSLDILTEARVRNGMAGLRRNLETLYAGYHVADLLDEWTRENDPHPVLYEESLRTLDGLGKEGCSAAVRLMHFEMVFLKELGYRPALEHCAGCQRPPGKSATIFSHQAGGVLCEACKGPISEGRNLTPQAREFLLSLEGSEDEWSRPWPSSVRAEVRQLLNGYLTFLRERPPRMLPYLGS